jgi:hypothetical protein
MRRWDDNIKIDFRVRYADLNRNYVEQINIARICYQGEELLGYFFNKMELILKCTSWFN